MSLIASMLRSKTYPLDEKNELAKGSPAMAVVTLSHTPVEHHLYAAMLNAVEVRAETSANLAETSSGTLREDLPEVFTVRRVMELAGSSSSSAIRRGLERLVTKLSVEREALANGSNGKRSAGRAVGYRVFTPEEVIARRDERGVKTFANRSEGDAHPPSFERVIPKILARKNLSRREAQVALCCVEGLTNAQIGSRLLVTEQTVKFHLRNIFVKFGVKRRAELISRLLM